MIKSTSKFRVEDVVYNKDGFAVARGYWEKNSEMSLACRWHDENGVGYPQTFGKPQWFMFPPDVIAEVSGTLDPKDSKVVITLS